MSLDKSIKHGKEFRQLYRGAKRFCKSCRNNGRCSYCKSNRLYKNLKRIQDKNGK